ncbi:MAG: MotA/TolQ/ExbB proton channel family protein [Candidatus Omnitrophota bacterium]|nr:MotA/TolQ/ExbB proton channel family protein [Candidatus Omnitrophota bacterium]
MIGQLLQSALFIGIAGMIGMLLYWQVDVIHRGGPVMIPIVMCSVFSMTLIIERLAFFLRLQMGMDLERFFEALRPLVDGRKWKDVAALCEATGGPVARVVTAGVAARDGAPQEIDDAMEEAAHAELPAVEQHLRLLSTLAQVSTLLGLLGTVTGLVRAFQIIQTKTTTGNPVNPGDLAGGVWEALITTVAGLIVAIPTIVAYNYLASRVAEVQFHMEKAAALIAGWRRHEVKGER